MATSTQPQRVVIRHLSGSKANQVEEFPLGAASEFSIGRSDSSDIRFDPDRDDLVSRHHAKLVQDPSDPAAFTLHDLDSSNGTFVNKQRVLGVARIQPTDVVQLGDGGPEFMFDLDPRPDSLMRQTRVASAFEAGSASSRATRVDPDRPPVPPVPTGAPGKQGVGRETLIREISSAKKQGNQNVLMAVGGVVLLVALVAGFFWWQSQERDAQQGTALADVSATANRLAEKDRPTRTEIIQANANKVVYIEQSWKLIYAPTGGQLYIQYENAGSRDRPNCMPRLVSSNGQIKPLLTLASSNNGCANESVGSSGTVSGTGFVVGADGFIITNRHVVASWYHGYQFSTDRGVMVVTGADGNPQWQVAAMPREWIPVEDPQLPRDLVQGGKVVEGRNDFLDVIFPKTDQRFEARRSAISEQHDVALIKTEVPNQLDPVQMKDTYDETQPGQPVTVMGYPAVSPMEAGGTENQSFDSRRTRVLLIPDPTATDGMVGRILRNERSTSGDRREDSYSLIGDYFQLTVNATGPGNSGGPVFDEFGDVIGIYSAGNRGPTGEIVSFAVPIRYALRLMGPTAVTR